MVNSFERSSRDLYKVLQVPRTASIAEIKASYRKLALKLHPDIHNDDPIKTAEFKTVTAAYTILSDQTQKISYDTSIGIRFNKNRRAPPPPDYRSVKFPPKPKHWKTVWDHQTHYDMHYGDGMYQEVLRQAKKREAAEAARTTGGGGYESPIGPGFAFSKANPELNRNPFSRRAARRPGRGVAFDYQETYVEYNGSLGGAGTQHQQQANKQKKHEQQQQQHTFDDFHRAKDNLHVRRSERYEQLYRQHKEEIRKARSNPAFSSRRDDTCVIL